MERILVGSGKSGMDDEEVVELKIWEVIYWMKSSLFAVFSSDNEMCGGSC
jgi:hypothetical protein